MPLPDGPRWPTPVQTMQFVRQPFAFFGQTRQKFGPIFTVRLAFFPDPIVVVGRRDDVEKVFTAPTSILSGAAGNAALLPIFGEHSLGLLEGPPHLRRRKLAGPAFLGNRASAYTATITEILGAALDEPARRGQSFALLPAMLDLAREVLLRTTFGLGGEQLEVGRETLGQLTKSLENPALLLMPALQRSFFGLSPWARFLRQRKAMQAWIQGEVERARKPGGEGRSDVLAALVRGVDEDGKPLLDVELQDEIITLLVAGHETTGTSLAWLFERVLATPGAVASLRDEVDRVAGDRPLEEADLERLERCDAAVKETLRTRPVSPGAFRKVVAPFEVGGRTIEPGAMIMANTYLAHHDAERYPSPETFDLQRFVGQKPDPYAWIPFGGGLRRCIGQAQAQHEMKTVLAEAVRRWDFELVGGPEPVRMRAVLQSPKNGVRVKIRTRAGAA